LMACTFFCADAPPEFVLKPVPSSVADGKPLMRQDEGRAWGRRRERREETVKEGGRGDRWTVRLSREGEEEEEEDDDDESGSAEAAASAVGEEGGSVVG